MPTPAMPARALREGLSGQVVAKFTVSGGAVKDITIESGPRVFHDAVIDTLQRYRCSITDTPVKTGQSFDFNVPSSSKRRVILLADGRQYHGETSNDGMISLPEGRGIEYEITGKIRRQGIWKEGELVEQREVNQYLYRFIPPSEKTTPPHPTSAPK
jgi:protein TonB